MEELAFAGLVLILAYAWITRTPTPGGFVSGEREPIVDRDPGDEQPSGAPPKDWGMCPRSHIAFVRESDGAIYCDRCGTIYWPDFAATYQVSPQKGTA